MRKWIAGGVGFTSSPLLTKDQLGASACVFRSKGINTSLPYPCEKECTRCLSPV